jgi:hypothetical protein
VKERIEMTEATKTISNETLVIDVVKNRGGFTRGIGKVFAFIIGGFGLLIASALAATIIGIIPALPIFLLSLGIIGLGMGKQHIACPHCKKKRLVMQAAENFTCAKCKNMTVVNWR